MTSPALRASEESEEEGQGRHLHIWVYAVAAAAAARGGHRVTAPSSRTTASPNVSRASRHHVPATVLAVCPPLAPRA